MSTLFVNKLKAAVGSLITSNHDLKVEGDITSTGYMFKQTNVYFLATNSVARAYNVNPYIFNATTFNDGGGYSTTTGKFTAPVAGIYYFHAHLLSTRTTSTGDCGFDWMVNDSQVKRIYDGKGGSANVHSECRGDLMYKLSVNDTVHIKGYATPGSGGFISSSTHNQFSGVLLG
jgi:hypothetical protein